MARPAGVRREGVPRRPSLAGDLRQRAEGFRRRRTARLPRALGAGRAAAQGDRAATVEPDEKPVTGFVFKVQANMDPNHRDRVAFVRLCSGKFRRGMKLFNVREKKTMNVAAPIFFFAQQRETIDEALSGRHHRHSQPRHAARRRHADRGRGAAVHRHSEFRAGNPAPRRAERRHARPSSSTRRCTTWPRRAWCRSSVRVDGSWPILGAVGALQLDVLASRLGAEYGVEARLEAAPYETARWIASDKPRRAAALLRCEPLGDRRGQCRLAGVSRAQRLGAEARGGRMAGHPRS